MTVDEMEAAFNANGGERGKYDRVEPKASGRPDLDAFILLNSLCPGNSDIIAASEHDEFYLSIEPADLAQVISEENIITLLRCGVMLDDRGLSMFT